MGVAGGVAAGQTVNAVVNAASGLVHGLPNAGIAQGCIFLVFGSNLGPSTIAIASSPFQSTSVGGTSVSITTGSTTVNAPMYYASAAQVAALLPSNTPTGAGTLIVTYNGTASAAVAVSIVQNNLGIFTFSQNGQGVADRDRIRMAVWFRRFRGPVRWPPARRPRCAPTRTEGPPFPATR